MWDVKGPYSMAVEEDSYFEWTTAGSQLTLDLLAVSKF
jgi:hypothetical protein